ncbi:nuclear transport factor 2 family protein [Cellulosimicrobium protaetiae]|uniref:Nuclear transport factor 2 family protein n=1 Tax=Cellulosimicrobium protaetiae TaxID=2587808 RepID=A0A6M5U9Y4_9MICO|nr:nuclear transport factor 2 family protein [Cellulosimicrobium protaetiae]QJW35276.1 nuclear transport factor 2 family protein [Cellulosimicrobium protaetiae]
MSDVSDAEHRATFAGILRAWGDALVANDPAAIDAFVEPGWVLVGTDGNAQERDGFLAVVASGELVHTEMSSELVAASVHDDVAVTLARGVSAGTWRGTPFRDVEWSVDTFVRRRAAWRCVHTAIVPAVVD